MAEKGKFWDLAEIFNAVIQDTDNFIKLHGKMKGPCYPNHNNLIIKGRILWEKNQDLSQWIIEMMKIIDIKNMNFDYTQTTSKSFDSAVESVVEEIAKAGMRVLYIHDVQKTLTEKGFERDPFKIVEFCNAKYANDFLNADIKIGLCMPCKINVYIKNGPASATVLRQSASQRREASAGKQTFISGMRPIILSQFFPNADLGNSPQEIDQKIQDIINNSK